MNEQARKEFIILQQDVTVPLYGNTRIFPYGKILVSDGTTEKWVRIKYDGIDPYFTFQRKRIGLELIGRFWGFKIKETK